VEPTNKHLLLAVDTSGSMSSCQIANMALTAREAAAALAMTFVRSESNTDIMYFDTAVALPALGRRHSYDQVFRSMGMGGGTDCSLPFAYALKTGKKYDAIIVLTDSETWHGHEHPVQAYAKLSPDTKVVLVQMTPSGYGLFPAANEKALNVAGFDASIPTLVNNFVRA
jgi:60 kDa SS-A/Ro ribonucleoprotein